MNIARSNDTQTAFEACVKAVRTRFSHLSEVDIAYPPAAWADAKLARQIAEHLAATRFNIEKARLAAELDRSRAAITTSIRSIDDRLTDPDFADAYAAMAETAKGRGA